MIHHSIEQATAGLVSAVLHLPPHTILERDGDVYALTNDALVALLATEPAAAAAALIGTSELLVWFRFSRTYGTLLWTSRYFIR